jgi:hypothetical protein
MANEKIRPAMFAFYQNTTEVDCNAAEPLTVSFYRLYCNGRYGIDADGDRSTGFYGLAL